MTHLYTSLGISRNGMQNHFTQVNMRGLRWNITWSTSSSTESLQLLVKWTTILRSVSNRQQPQSVFCWPQQQETNRYSLPLSDFSRDLMLISKKPESCWLAMAAAPCPPFLLWFPSNSSSSRGSWAGTSLLSALCDARCCADETLRKQTSKAFPLLLCPVLSYQSSVSPLLPLSTLYLSKAVGVGGNTSFSLNNCEEAESAGSNPLSAAQLIITTVGLNAGPDDEDDSDLSVWLAKCDRSPTVTGELG